jgi:hypothetical protein
MEKNTKAYNRITNISDTYFAGEKELAKRVEFARTVIRNTLHKFPKELWPEELSWAMQGGRYTGFTFVDYNDKAVEINEENPLNRYHKLSFFIIGQRGWTTKEYTIKQASIPAYLLFNDPMAIAQYARKLIRIKQSQIRTKEAMDITKQVEDVSKKIANLAEEQAKLEKQRTEIRERNQRAREAIKKNREKQEKRQAAKRAKASS